MRGRRTWFKPGVIAIGLAGIAAPVTSRAGSTLTWDIDPVTPGAQGGAGTWNPGSTTNWFNGTSDVAWNNANVDSALFAGTGGAVILGGSIAAKYVTVASPGYSFAGGGFVFTAIGTVDTGIFNDVDTTVAAAIKGSSGADGWFKDGVGTLTLSGDNSLSVALHVRAGTVSVANVLSLPSWTHVTGPARILYTGPSANPLEYLDAQGTNTATIDVASAATTLNVTQLGGAFAKAGPGTLFAPKIGGTVRIDEGALLLDRSVGAAVTVNGGALLLHANSPTNFANAVLVTGNRPGVIDVDRATSAGTTNVSHTLASLSVASGATLSLHSSNGWSLTAQSLTNTGTIDLGSTLLRVTTNALADASVSPAAHFAFGHNDTAAAPTARGLWIDNGKSNTVSATYEGTSDDSDLLLGVKSSQLTLGGAWRGGAAGATSTLAFSGTPNGDYIRITLSGTSHFNNLTADRTGLRPVTISGNGTSKCQLVFDRAFVADHSAQGTIDDGLGRLQLGDVNWLTSDSKSLPVVSMRTPSGGVHRAGTIVFDNGTTGADSGVLWQINTAAQTYDGGVNLKQSAAISASWPLTFSGRVDDSADNQFQIAANRTLTLSGASVTFDGDMGCAPGSRIKVGAYTKVNFNTDPGAGWYEGNYTRGIDGAIASVPDPSHTLSVSVATNSSGLYTRFSAPVTHLGELVLSGKALVGGAGHPSLLSVGSHLSVARSSGNYLELAVGNAAVLRASTFHTSATVRSMIIGKDIRSSLPDASHSLGYARSGDALTAGADGSYSFFGEKVGADDILVRSTLFGDANLNGAVDFNDLVRLAQSYGVVDGTRQWSSGDFNYDGNTDFDDLVKLAQNYNAALPTAPVPGAPADFQDDLAAAFASVPEPTAVPFVIACGLLAVRRRKRARAAPPLPIGAVVPSMSPQCCGPEYPCTESQS